MTSYTVTIAPDDPALAITTIRLDLAGGEPTVRELRMVPGEGGALLADGLPVLDLNHLVSAVLAAVSPTRSASAKRAGRPATRGVPRQAAADRRQDAPSAPGAAPVLAALRQGPATAERDARVAAAPKPSRAAGQARKERPAGQAPKKATASAAPDRGGRTYRQMPEDFAEVMRQVGDSAGIIADHYDVPRHTAYGWIRTARKRTAA
ncbi:hypothetical protein [Catellatospora sp. NPDC049133]|uniref:hypothetical protein n=1 Tax=Catellatospora sp. NPDC049133 TaxID=3155499 RepID=UPI00340E9E23